MRNKRRHALGSQGKPATTLKESLGMNVVSRQIGGKVFESKSPLLVQPLSITDYLCPRYR